MIGVLFIVAVAVFAFVAGSIVGATNAATVQNSIATLKSAEQKAQATIATITAHKAS